MDFYNWIKNGKTIVIFLVLIMVGIYTIYLNQMLKDKNEIIKIYMQDDLVEVKKAVEHFKNEYGHQTNTEDNFSSDIKIMLKNIKGSPTLQSKLIVDDSGVKAIDYTDSNISCSDFNLLKVEITKITDINVSVDLLNNRCN